MDWFSTLILGKNLDKIQTIVFEIVVCNLIESHEVDLQVHSAFVESMEKNRK